MSDLAKSSTRYTVVSHQWLAEHLGDADLRILDTRSNVMDYFPGHVPGAVHLSDFSLRAPIDGLPVQYLDTSVLAGLFHQAGVTDGMQVVVYAEAEQTIGATMAIYALELLGFDRVSYLDGGWPVYRDTESASQEYPSYQSADSDLKARPNRGIGIQLEELTHHLEQEGSVLIDARPARYYLAQPPRTWIRDGHVPGAINIDWHGLMHANNLSLLRPTAELEALFAAMRVNREQDIVVMCGTSREASMEYFVLKHLLGFPRVRLYEGSWTEWSAHPELPVETEPTVLP